MQRKSATEKSAALTELARDVYGDVGFGAMKTGFGIVATKWDLERPMIFKANPGQAHGRWTRSPP